MNGVRDQLHGNVGCGAVFVEPRMVYCNVSKAVNGIHFVRNLMSGLAWGGGLN